MSNLHLSDVNFRNVGDESDPASRLQGFVHINGVPHHLEAVAVKKDEEGNQIGVNQECEEILSDLYVEFSPDTPFQTVTHNGREYVFYMSPSY